MTKIQITNKIAALDFWLTNNPHHADYQVMLQDKKNLELKIINKDYE